MTKKQESKDFIVKSNSLIEARYRLSLQESQVILWLLTKIKPNDEDFKPHKLKIAEFAKLVEVNVDSKYRELRGITRQLLQRVMEIHESKTNETIQVAWLSSAHYKNKQGYVYLEFSPKLKPYLLQLRSHFTKIDIVDTLKLKSIYAIRIFELLLQHLLITKRTITIEEIRGYLGIPQNEYSKYSHLKEKIFNKAKSEINTKTEYNIDFTEIKESRKIVAIEWIIHKKNLQTQDHKAVCLQKELRSKEIIITNLLEYGFSKMIAKRLLTLHGEDTIKNAIRAVDLQIERKHAKNPKAMLQTAIQEKWHPEVYKKRK